MSDREPRHRNRPYSIAVARRSSTSHGEAVALLPARHRGRHDTAGIREGRCARARGRDYRGPRRGIDAEQSLQGLYVPSWRGRSTRSTSKGRPPIIRSGRGSIRRKVRPSKERRPRFGRNGPALAHVCTKGLRSAPVCKTGGFGVGPQSARRAFVTAADVARRAGVSRSAVSRAFTPGASVSIKARERILRAADHLGYRVNRLAQSLINARSNVIGLVGTDLQQPFHAEFLATLSGALLADGFQCMLLNAANAERDMSALIARVLEYRVFAIVVITGSPPARIVEECLNKSVPVILVNKLLP